MNNDATGAIAPQIKPGVYRGTGSVTRHPELATVRVDGVLDPSTCQTYPEIDRFTGNPSESRVVQYDGADSTPARRHYTTLGKVEAYDDPREVTIECSSGVCAHLREGLYQVFWSLDGRLVLVKAEDIRSDGTLDARLSPAPQRSFAGGASAYVPPFEMSRSYVTARVPLDISSKCLGRLSQRYTERFIALVVTQLDGREFPLAFDFERENDQGVIAAVRPFGHTVFHSVQADADGRLTVDIEAPSEVVAHIREGRWSLELMSKLNRFASDDATETTAARGLCAPQVVGFRLYPGKLGFAMDLDQTSVILDAPG